jgi:hypothetical protein
MNPKTKKAMTQTHKLLSIAALFAMGALTISCNSLKEQLDTPEEVPATGKTVTLTATVGLGATTKALDATGAKTFAVGDQIAVIYTQEGGTTAKAVSNALTIDDIREEGQKADITVTLDTPAENGTIRYIYPASMALATIAAANPIDDAHTIDFTNLSAQDGTLATLAGSYDLAVFDGTLNGLELPASALLSNQLAIGEFTIKNWGGTAITTDLTAFSVTDGTNTYDIAPASPATNLTGPIYVAMLPVADTQELTFTATDGTYTYTRSVTGKALAKNNMYPVNLKMNRSVVLDNVTTHDGNDVYFLAAVDKDIISGSFDSGGGYITIPDGATVTLNRVNFSSPIECDYAPLHCLGDANIVLADGSYNDLFVSSGSYPAVFVPKGSTLTISGSGGLSAYGYNGTGSGIGGGYIYSTDTGINCGTIIIAGGVIVATGGQYSAGIGSSGHSSCDGIRITGGVIKSATGGNFAAGIGCGGDGSCGNIEISGGQIGGDYGGWLHDGAIGGERAAGIGCGRAGTCGNITIGAGITFIRAQKGESANYCIGRSASGTCGTVTIGSGLTVEDWGAEMYIHPTTP